MFEIYKKDYKFDELIKLVNLAESDFWFFKDVYDYYKFELEVNDVYLNSLCEKQIEIDRETGGAWLSDAVKYNINKHYIVPADRSDIEKIIIDNYYKSEELRNALKNLGYSE